MKIEGVIALYYSSMMMDVHVAGRQAGYMYVSRRNMPSFHTPLPSHSMTSMIVKDRPV